jgi:putative Mg2+ transporter-C (MgtC) family protein
MNGFFQPTGQGWGQIGDLVLALILSSMIGLEREYRQKSAGLRTYTLVGLAAALIMLVSKFGFGDVLQTGRIVLDPSRVAAQIVTGIGFIGGGVIFMRRELVRGLTTAAIVWLTAAVGMACGAGLPLLALTVTAGHFVVVSGFPYIARRLPGANFSTVPVRLTYEAGRGTLRNALAACTARRYTVAAIEIASPDNLGDNIASVTVTLQGVEREAPLASMLSDIPGTLSVHVGNGNGSGDSLT